MKESVGRAEGIRGVVHGGLISHEQMVDRRRDPQVPAATRNDFARVLARPYVWTLPYLGDDVVGEGVNIDAATMFWNDVGVRKTRPSSKTAP